MTGVRIKTRGTILNIALFQWIGSFCFPDVFMCHSTVFAILYILCCMLFDRSRDVFFLSPNIQFSMHFI